MSFSKSRFLASLLSLALLCSVASAGTIPLGSFMGSTVSFDNLVENNGDPLVPVFPSLYAPVSVSGNTLSFGTSNFSLTATTPGVPAVLDHSISFSVVAKPGETIQSVSVDEDFFGTVSVPDGIVQAFFGGPANTFNPSGVVSDSSTFTFSSSGGVVDNGPLLYTFPTPVTRADFTIDNRLIALFTEQNGLALISKAGIDITVVTGVVPEPTSATIFACAFGMLTTVRRRRR